MSTKKEFLTVKVITQRCNNLDNVTFEQYLNGMSGEYCLKV